MIIEYDWDIMDSMLTGIPVQTITKLVNEGNKKMLLRAFALLYTVQPDVKDNPVGIDVDAIRNIAIEALNKNKGFSPHKSGDKVHALCFDFDGVIHSFVSGWIQHNIIPDEPVDGIRELLQELYDSKKFVIMVYSSRCGYGGGVEAIEDYMDKHSLPYHIVCEHKPNAAVYIDDLGYKFTTSNVLRDFLLKEFK